MMSSDPVKKSRLLRQIPASERLPKTLAEWQEWIKLRRGDGPPLLLALERRLLEEAASRLDAESAATGGAQEASRLVVAVIGAVEEEILAVDEHLAAQRAALESGASAPQVVLETCEFLGSAGLELSEDRKAVRRWLDWAAVEERARKKQGHLRRLEQFLISLAGRALAEGDAPPLGKLRDSGFLEAAARNLARPIDARLEREWIEAAWRVYEEEPETDRSVDLSDPDLRSFVRRGLASGANVWSEGSAWLLWLAIEPVRAAGKIRERLRRSSRSRDDFFLRRYLIDHAVPRLEAEDALAILTDCLAGPDPSPHVQQGAILALAGFSREAGRSLLRAEEGARNRCPQVHAAVARTLAEWTKLDGLVPDLAHLWGNFFANAASELPIRMGLLQLADACEALAMEERLDPRQAASLAAMTIDLGSRRGWTRPLRRLVEDLAERVRVAGLPEFIPFVSQVLPSLDGASPGDRIVLRSADVSLSPDALGSLLAWAARTRFGFYATPTDDAWTITIHARRTFRLWRWLHETRNPQSTKRQGFGHVTGSTYSGTLRAHSGSVAGESVTPVPGEPVVSRAQGTWCRFLPLMDDFLDALGMGELSLFSSEGVTRVAPPASLGDRIRCRWELTRRYSDLAGLRQACLEGRAAPNDFADRMRAAGFSLEFVSRVAPLQSSAAEFFAGGAR